MNKIKLYEEYCTGCGLCHSINGVVFEKDDKGYSFPILREDDLSLCDKVCPASGYALLRQSDDIWGDKISVYLGWSLDKNIRYAASSGGALTQICLYLISNHLVDGIIQTCVSDKFQHRTMTIVSRTEDDVRKCMGSKYAISIPLYEIKNIVKPGEKYAVVGKPCDISSLRMYLEQDDELSEQIVYLLSFFCAGEPSDKANLKLLSELGCNNPMDCKTLRYRGDGWPGYATAERTDGEKKSISYDDSWGKILGRDIRKACRFCMDGVGEMADISCGDAWYLTKTNEPDFTEADGRNVIFARTEKGAELLQKCVYNGMLHTEPFEMEQLRHIQKYQYMRKEYMGSMISAMKLLGRPVPKYKKLARFSKRAKYSTKLKHFLGVLKRVLQGKI